MKAIKLFSVAMLLIFITSCFNDNKNDKNNDTLKGPDTTELKDVVKEKPIPDDQRDNKIDTSKPEKEL